MKNQNEGQRREASRGEDYGGPGDYPDADAEDKEADAKYSGGTTGTRQGNSEGEQFGEFGHTGTGIDLTEEMDETDTGRGLGLVKGGEHGADDVAGPAQYGGDAGGLKKSK